MSAIHEALAPISWLAGRWITEDGKGHYPKIKDFQYHEELEFVCVGQPMFNYLSSSKHPESKKPLHQERGFLRVNPGSNDIAFVVSHNFGLTSIEEGSCDPEKKEIKLFSKNVSSTSYATPPHVTKLTREIKLLEPDTLEIILSLETEKTPMNEHLRAVYKKV